MRKRRIFFDEDGTLNVWEKENDIDTVSAPGYMRYRTPIRNMVEAARILSCEYEIWVASAVLPFDYAIPDKDYWADENIIFVPKYQRVYIPYGTDKSNKLREYAAAGDVFIDDYSRNLREVENIPGVICVKCMNGINDTNKSWHGARVSIYSDPEIIAATIEGLIMAGSKKKQPL